MSGGGSIELFHNGKRYALDYNPKLRTVRILGPLETPGGSRWTKIVKNVERKDVQMKSKRILETEFPSLTAKAKSDDDPK